jgi:transglutaminase-like putative cysteine protease
MRFSGIWSAVLSCGLLLLLNCSSSTGFREVNLSEFELPDVSQEKYPDASAVVILDEARVDITHLEDQAFSTMKRHRIVKILNEDGFRHANFIIPFDDHTEVLDLKARSIRPDGQIIPLNTRYVYETSLYPDYVFYSDLKSLRFAMPAVEPGTILEFEWELQARNFTFWTRWPFQQADPVRISRYIVRFPRSININWKSYAKDIQPEIISDGSQYVTYIWELRDAPAFRPETGMPPGMTEIPSLLFSPVGIASWDAVAGWYQHLAENRMRPDRSVTQTVDSLLTGVQKPLEKLQVIFEFVRDKVRYLAIEIGIGGYQPHPARQVLTHLYGDCKDMATLIVAMAEAAGIDADPVLISTWQNGQMDTTLVSPAQFNHAIAVATLSDSTTVWMDPTDKQTAFGELPWYDQNRLVLVVDDDSSKALLITTPGTGQENQSSREWNLILDDSGRWAGSVSMRFVGTPARNLRLLLRKKPDFVHSDWCEQELLKRFPGADVSEYAIHGLDKINQPLQIDIHFSTGICSDSTLAYTVFQPGTWSQYDWHRLFAPTERFSDIAIEYSLIILDEAHIQYPVTWAMISKPASVSRSEPFGGYYFRIRADSNRIEYKRYFRISEPRIHRSQYDRFRNFLNEVAWRDCEPVILTVNP